MNRIRCEQKEPPDAVHANDNPPFDPLAWRRKYMRLYMQKRRERQRAAKAKEQVS
jgi:hypothetical protein